jgi:hypothetical protein
MMYLLIASPGILVVTICVIQTVIEERKLREEIRGTQRWLESYAARIEAEGFPDETWDQTDWDFWLLGKHLRGW